MALIVEDGTGLVDAESYASEAAADLYFAARGNPLTWTTLTTAQKEQWLRQGTEFMDLEFGARWKGRRVTQLQALDWPRSGVNDESGFTIGSDSVPIQLERATIEMAHRQAIDQTDLMPDLDTSANIKRERLEVGPIELDTTYAGSSNQQAAFVKVEKMIRELVTFLGASGIAVNIRA